MTDIPHLSDDDAKAWFSEKMPEEWHDDIEALVDRDEILIVVHLPDAAPADEGADEQGALDPEERIDAFREHTRDARVKIAKRAEAGFRRKVSWAAQAGETRVVFTHLSVPTMTRLRMTERHVLDTLVAAGVARSRSDAVGWCVRQVSERQGEWLGDLNDAISAVERIREQGPS